MNFLTITAFLSFASLSQPALSQDDSMSHSEIDEMVDDLGGGSNASGSGVTSGSGMNGNGNGNGNGSTTTASYGATESSAPINDFSTQVADLEGDDADEDAGVDKEIGESGAQDAMYEHYSGRGGTPEPEMSSSLSRSDSYNAPIVKKSKVKSKKKHVKKSKKSKHKIAKSKKRSKNKLAKASGKKHKNHRMASRKTSSKRRIR